MAHRNTTSRLRRLAAAAAIGSIAAVGSPALATPRAAAGDPTTQAVCYSSSGKLFCDHKWGATSYAERSYDSPVRDHLYRYHSTFECWGYGKWHEGGNNIWYWVKGTAGNWGNVPAINVMTSYDPFPGVNEC